MGRMRVSIVGMIAALVACAMAFAALRTASNLWFSAVYTFTVVLLLVAVIAARWRRGAGAAFWYGFAVFGWGFFLLGSGSWLNPLSGDSEDAVGGQINRGLLTSRLVLFLVPRLRMGTDDPEAIDRITANSIGIAHLLITLALAACGGVVGVLLRRRRKRTSERDRSGHAVASVVILVAPVLGIAASMGGPERPVARFLSGVGPDRISSSESQWYSKHLAAIDEPPLWATSERGREELTYRWLWLPSFGHPICLRIDRKGDRAELRALVLDGAGGYEPGQVAIERTVALRLDRWEEIAGRIETTRFWEMPTYDKPGGYEDATHLIWEGSGRGRYHLVVRCTPIPNECRSLFRSLIELAGIKPGGVRD